MKIGLIGINRYAKFLNFACDLHIYAFQQYLLQHGYDSTVLDYKPAYYNGFDMRNPAPKVEQQYRDAVKRKASDAALEKVADLALGYRSVTVERERRYDKFEAFVEKNLIFTEEKYDSDLLEVIDPGFDCYMCVTDVIWQSIDKHVFDRGFMLGSKAFEDKEKISYAASRGASKDFDKQARKQFFEYLGNIDSISVREQDFAKYIEDNSNLVVTTVLDPVLLHDRDFWQQVTVKPDVEKYLVLYYVMERSTDTIAKAVEYAKLHDLTIVEVSDRPLKYGKITDPDVKHISRYDVGMEEWLGYIENAECVFTNSFHGCCFAAVFETPLFVGKRNGQKVPNFLRTVGLSSRQFAPDVDVSTLSTEVDFAPVREALTSQRKHSEEFLLTALQEAEARVRSKQESGTSEPGPERRKGDARRRAIKYPVRFHSGLAKKGVELHSAGLPTHESKRVGSGALEYSFPGARYANDGSNAVPDSAFIAPDKTFKGWTVRFRIDNHWFWCLDDGSIGWARQLGEELEGRKKVFKPGERIPHLPVNSVNVAVLVAQWDDRPPSPAEAKKVRVEETLPAKAGRHARRVYEQFKKGARKRK